MGFWYFLILFIGIFLIIQALRKRARTLFKRMTILATGVCLVGISLFMFQDGSAEIIAKLLNL